MAALGVGLTWGVALALVVASALGFGPWPSLERFVLTAAGTGAVGLMEHRRTAPLMAAYRLGSAAAIRHAAEEDHAPATVHALHQIR